MGSPPRAIGVFGHYGNENLGDETIVAAVIQNARRHCPGAKIYCFSVNPEDSRRRHDVPSFPIARRAARAAGGAGAGLAGGVAERVKRLPLLAAPLRALRRAWWALGAIAEEPAFIARALGAARKLDLLLVAGSGQITDGFGGAGNFPLTIFKWALLARAAGARLAFASVGAGPIRSPVSRLLLRAALRLGDYRSFRDASSRDLVGPLGAALAGPVVPDLAYSFDAARPAPRVDPEPLRACELGTVGLNPLPWYDGRYWPEADGARYAAYVRSMAALAGTLLAGGRRVRLFATNVRADSLVIRDVRDAVTKEGISPEDPRVLAAPVASIDDLAAAIRACDLVVATRFHGVLISLLLGVPVVAIAYQQKTRDLMASAGHLEQCFDIDRLDPAALAARIRWLEANREAVRRGLAERLASLRRALDAQYRQVFAL